MVASPRIGSMPQATSATSEIRIGRSPVLLIAVRPMASRSVVIARFRIMISVAPVLRNPPVLELAAFAAADSSSSSVTP